MTTHVAPTRSARRAAPRVQGSRHLDRHPVDLVRVLLGLGVLGVGFLIAQRGQLPLLERDLFRLLNDLPALVFPVVWVVMQLGNVVAVPVVATVAATTGRFRMSRDLLVSGLLAYGAADLVKTVVGRERPAGLPVGAVLHEGTVGGAGFVSGHSAVAAALAAAASPYLSRRWRRVVWVAAWSVALARVYVGAHLPLDVVGGVALGWAIGALVHWVFGVPRWDVPTARVDAALRRLGLPLSDLAPAAVRARSSHPFQGVDESGRLLYVKVLDPDRFERDWLYRLWRLVAVRDVKDADAVAPLGQQAEHEAVAAMTARERGVRVPAVLLARGTGHDALVVQEHLGGRPLDELSAAEVTTDLLDEVWRQVARLHAARIAHHDLVASSVLVDDGGRPWVVDFGNAETGADDDALAGDVAELMASLALRFPPDLVAASALARLGTDAVTLALPRLAPLTLSSETRRRLAADGPRLDLLRRELRDRLGLPDPARPVFPPAGPVAVAAVALGALLVLVGVPLLGGAGAVLEAVEVGGWRWLGGAVALAVLARAAMATAALATVDRRLAVGRTYVATVVADGASLVHGREGWRRAGAVFLEGAGVLPDAGRLAARRLVVATGLGAAAVAVASLTLGFVEASLPDWQGQAGVVPALLLGLPAWALILTGQWLARRSDPVAPPPGSDRVTGAGLFVLGRRWPAQVGWAAVAVAVEAAALAAALQAVGGGIPLFAVATAYAALRLLWTAVPVTGTAGAADVSLLLTLTVSGVPLAGACAAVVAFRLVTFWLPAATGLLVRARLEHRLGW